MIQKTNMLVVWRTAGALLLTAVLALTACGGGTSAPGQNLNAGTAPAPDSSPANPAPAADNSPAVPAPSPAAPANTTSSFGIPAGLTGTVDSGGSVWSSSCTVCHGSMGARTFTQLQAAMGKAPMTSLNLSQQQLADLTAYLNRNSIPAPAPSPTPAPAPAPATGGGDSGGGTPPAPAPAPPADTTTGFGIPAGLTGSVTTGGTIFSSSCTTCHGSLGARSYGQLQSAMGISAMKSLNLSQQQLADLTAYLNRGSIQGGGTPGGSTGGGIGDDDGDDDDDSSYDPDDDEGESDEHDEEEDDEEEDDD